MELETYYPKNKSEWRKWLTLNHEAKQSIWLVMYKKATEIPSISWSEAVDEALCFGWIDSTKKSIDKESYMQYFSRRKPKSMWSRVNKDKVDYLIKNNLMRKAGQDSIDIAKKNGSWNILDDVDNLIVPDDLQSSMEKNSKALEFFENQSKSIKKMMLYWVISAKRKETRDKRISDIVMSASKGVKPKHFG